MGWPDPVSREVELPILKHREKAAEGPKANCRREKGAANSQGSQI